MTAKRIFITGGASGLGKALAERYYHAGFKVLIGDIDTEAGEAVAKSHDSGEHPMHFISCDVTKEADLIKARDWLSEHWSGLDILVNNAGVAAAGYVDNTPIKDWQWVTNINLFGVVRGCKVFIPLFKEQGHGHIVNIASLAGIVHSPGMGPYNAVKAGVVALSETLTFELAWDNIDVSVVCPSFFRTNILSRARSSDPTFEAKFNALVNGSGKDANDIAEAVFKGVENKTFMIMTDGDGFLARLAKRLLPFKLYKKALTGYMAQQAKARMK